MKSDMKENHARQGQRVMEGALFLKGRSGKSYVTR